MLGGSRLTRGIEDVIAFDPWARCLRTVPGFRCHVMDASGVEVMEQGYQTHPYSLADVDAVYVLLGEKFTWVQGRYRLELTEPLEGRTFIK